jgi:hypothetical protein
MGKIWIFVSTTLQGYGKLFCQNDEKLQIQNWKKEDVDIVQRSDDVMMCSYGGAVEEFGWNIGQEKTVA